MKPPGRGTPKVTKKNTQKCQPEKRAGKLEGKARCANTILREKTCSQPAIRLKGSGVKIVQGEKKSRVTPSLGRGKGMKTGNKSLSVQDTLHPKHGAGFIEVRGGEKGKIKARKVSCV